MCLAGRLRHSVTEVVMTKISQLLLTAALASLIAIPPAAAAQASGQKPAREQPSQAPASQASAPASQQTGQPPMGSSGEKNDRQAVMLTGQIQQQNGQYVLSDSGVSYKLDQQDKAKRFVGQKVK